MNNLRGIKQYKPHKILAQNIENITQPKMLQREIGLILELQIKWGIFSFETVINQK